MGFKTETFENNNKQERWLMMDDETPAWQCKKCRKYNFTQKWLVRVKLDFFFVFEFHYFFVFSKLLTMTMSHTMLFCGIFFSYLLLSTHLKFDWLNDDYFQLDSIQFILILSVTPTVLPLTCIWNLADSRKATINWLKSTAEK